MAPLVILIIPLLGAVAALLLPSERWRPWLLPACSAMQSIAVWVAIGDSSPPWRSPWLLLDPLGKIFLCSITGLFFFSSLSAVNYLRLRPQGSNRIFCACLLAFLASMSLVTMAGHLGLMWIAVEATTLASAPLIYFDRNPRSLEAAWKYLALCSVGIALGLMGSFLLAYASMLSRPEGSLFFPDLIQAASSFPHPWLKVAFAVLVVGYGTKMGLAPMHAWLPDAHSEAPAPVSALLSGALLPCAFLAILRAYVVLASAGEAPFARRILLVFGIFSMAVAVVFLLSQKDYKRMLAYSSVEHMGILAIGIGTGGLAIAGALLHALNHALAKGALFLSAGNLYLAYGSKTASDVRGALGRAPVSASIFLLGFLAITGSPPFGPFISQFMIIREAFARGLPWIAALVLLFLAVGFIGMGMTALPMLGGSPSRPDKHSRYRETFAATLPLAALMAAVLTLGIYHPPGLTSLLRQAANYLERVP